ncbi:MAG TPA: malto-oligosyltrehalose synthase [Myxococcales bacterium]|jgi:(1->4)-alpha-D-glucan 1-alpha-D-glucosylmutase
MPADEERRAQAAQALLSEVERELARLARRPVATYRLQLQLGFGLREAAELVPYLAALGVSDLYASPYLKAVPGSTHGYDVVDHREINPELGGREALEALCAELAARGMGHVLDFVPNHMAIGPENPMWMDVLENGPSSVYAGFFDVDWKPIKEELENRVLVPVLGDQYGAVLERGELGLVFEGSGFQLAYGALRFPVTPRQYPQILRHRIDELQRALPAGDVHFEDYLSIVNALARLPPRSETDPARIEERHREKEVLKRRIAALCEACPQVRAFVEENVRIFNGTVGDPRSFDLLDKLLREQAYRLAFWKVAAEEINYRRFFDINGLAAIRMEDPRVLRQAHTLVLDLVAQGKLGGLRIDHPDGLFDPADYFASLQEELSVTVARRLAADAEAPAGAGAEPFEALEGALREAIRRERGRGPASPLFRPLYVVAEKILAGDEALPGSWAVHGTTGYDFLNAVNGLFVDARGARPLDELFTRFTGLRPDWGELVYQKRRETMADSMASEINVLARRLNRISEFDRRTRDFTLGSLRRVLVEVLACFPVYRTYRSHRGEPADERDRRYVEAAVAQARRRNPTLNASLFAFLREVLLGRPAEVSSVDAQAEAAERERVEFVLKLQQVTAPVMAKSVEDTAFYLYNRLVSLNEVGGEPARFGTGLEAFHAANRVRAERWPGSLTATSTHDSKRSEDVRARIDVLSEVPGEWRKRVVAWSRLNRHLKTALGDRFAPDRNEELLLYQTLVGTWPSSSSSPSGTAGTHGREWEQYRARIQAYSAKALREAKLHTSWLNPDEEWEKAVADFVAAALDPRRAPRFLKDLAAFSAKVARAGAFNSLSQVLLKVASPGVPDLYQGSELWDLSLVDPDNRRPVDFALRRELLASLDVRAAAQGEAALAQEVLERLEDGRVKLYVTSRALRLRRRFPDLFQHGEYLSLWPEGDRSRSLVTFARSLGAQAAVVVAPRLVAGLLEKSPDLTGERAWSDASLPLPASLAGATLVDTFTGRRVRPVEAGGRPVLPVAATLDAFPLALLVPEGMAGGEGDERRAQAPAGPEPQAAQP